MQLSAGQRSLRLERLEPRWLLTTNADFNSDFRLDVDDIDALRDQLITGGQDLRFDADGSGQVAFGDLNRIISQDFGTFLGDVNLDGRIRRADLVQVVGKYGQSNVSWADGDFNADDAVGLRDIARIFQNTGRSGVGLAFSGSLVVGDFDGDGSLGVGDLDTLIVEIASGSPDERFDLTGDSAVDLVDLEFWRDELYGAPPGDVNLDGVVDRSDLAIVAAGWGQIGAPPWSAGNVNGDGVIGLGDLAIVQRGMGDESASDPVLASQVQQIVSSIVEINSNLSNWTRLFDLHASGASGSADGVALAEGDDLPIVPDDLATLLDLDAALENAVPSVQATGASAVLRSQLLQHGFEVILFPGGPEGGPDNTELRIRYQGTVDGLTATSSFSRASAPALAGLNPAADLVGTLDYGTPEAPSTAEFDLVLGVDEQGVYLLGESEIRLNVRAEGEVTAGFDLGVAGLGVEVGGTVSADYDLVLSQPDPARRVRIDELDDDAESIWTVGIDGSGAVDLNLEYTQAGASTGEVLTGSLWEIPVVGGEVQPVVGGLAAPDADQLLRAAAAVFQQNLRSLSDEAAALFDAIAIPLSDAASPINVSGALTNADADVDASLLQHFSELFVNFFGRTDQRGEGLFYTLGDQYLEADDFRAVYDVFGEGVTVGVISDGVEGWELAAQSGDLPPEVRIRREADGALIGKGAEGTAMLELIHDIAPGAELAFASGATDDYAQAIEWLIETAGATIVVTDLISANHVFSPSPAATMISEYVDGTRLNPETGLPYDVLFVAAAGNERDKQIRVAGDPAEFQFNDQTLTLHRFAPSLQSPLLEISIPPKGSHDLILTWDDPFFKTPEREYKIRAFRQLVDGQPILSGNQLVNVEEVAVSALTGEAWTELTSLPTADEGDDDLRLLIAIDYLDSNPTEPVVFDLVDSGKLGLFSLSTDSQIVAEAALPGVLTVGAIEAPDEFRSMSQIEAALNLPSPSSSVGPPGLGAFQPGDPLTPLDVMGISVVSVSGSGWDETVFPGTSAAAPQVAAVAALLKSLEPNATWQDLTLALHQSADDIVLPEIAAETTGYDRFTGFGRVDALQAGAAIQAIMGGQPLQAPIIAALGEAGGGAGHEPGGPGLIDTLNAVDGWAVSAASESDLRLLLEGAAPPEIELFSIQLTTDPEAYAPLELEYDVPIASLAPGLSDMSPQAKLTLGVRPDFDIHFGLDEDGFYLDSASRLALDLEGGFHGSADLEIFEVALGGHVALTPELLLAGTDADSDGRIRPSELLANLVSLRVGLAGDVEAGLQTDLQINFLDYVELDPRLPNEIGSTGDPFILSGFVEAALDPNLDGDGNFQFTVADWGLRNPDIDGNGFDDHTTAVLAENIIRFASDELNGESNFFGPDGALLSTLGSFNVPLVDQPLADLLPLDLVPDFDTGVLETLGDIAGEVLERIEVLEIVSFDAIEQWMQTGSLPAGEELARLKFSLDDIELGFIDDLQAALGNLLPDSIDPTGLVRIENARLAGSIVVGLDFDGGPYLLLEDDQGGHTDATRVGVAFDVVADLSGLPLDNEILLLEQAEIRVSPQFYFTLDSSDPKLRFDELITGAFSIATEFDIGPIELFARRAALFPNNADAMFRGSVEGLRGTVELSGAIDVMADRVVVAVSDAVLATAGNVGFSFDPTNPSGTITVASLQNATLEFPSLPLLPETKVDGLTIEYTPATSTFRLNLDELTISPGGGSSGVGAAAEDPAGGEESGVGSGSAEILRPVIIVPTVGVTQVPVEGQLVLPGQMGEGTGAEAEFASLLSRAPYQDTIDTLVNAGYVLGDNLFIAHYDWRLPLAPMDDTNDGFLENLTALDILPGPAPIDYAVDYLGYWFEHAVQRWEETTFEETPTVDVIAHGTGGLLARAYVQSNAPYSFPISDGVIRRDLPLVERLVMLGVPNQGAPDDAALLNDQWLESELQNALVAPTVNAAFERIKEKGSIVGPNRVITRAEIVDPDTDEPDPQLFIRAYLLSSQSSQPTGDVIDFENSYPKTLGPVGGATVDPTQPITLQFSVPTDIQVESYDIYLSVKEPGTGLFPTDNVDGVTQTNHLGEPDVHAKRILTDRVTNPVGNGGVFEFTLPTGLELTAGQRYYWGVEVTTADGDTEQGYDQFRTNTATNIATGSFSSVTLLTHDRQIAYVDRSIPQDYLELAHSLAEASDGQVRAYNPANGLFEEVKKANGRDSYNPDEGKSLILVADWAVDSAISDTGFAESAADALFAALVGLDQQLGFLSEDNPLFGSPLHFIGAGRGASVNTEIIQRIGIFGFAELTPDIHVTTLDPFDFEQKSLSVPMNYLLQLAKEHNLTAQVLGALSIGDETFVRYVLQTLTGTSEVQYGNFRDPEVVTWDIVSFHDNYYQEAADPRSQDPDLEDITTISFSPNGREIESADLNVLLSDGFRERLNGDDAGAPDREGFFEDNRARAHRAVNAWYAGTADLSLDQFSTNTADGEFKKEGDPGITIVRGLNDIPLSEVTDQKRPWYPSGEASEDNWEGTGLGWYYSVLGGGSGVRPASTSTADRVPVTYDNSQRPTPNSQNSTAVATVFNGHFDETTRPAYGRYPIPVPLTDLISKGAAKVKLDKGVKVDKVADAVGVDKPFQAAVDAVISPDTLAAFKPSHLEAPGWSFHGGGNDLGMGDKVVHRIDAYTFIGEFREQLNQIVPQDIRNLTSFVYGSNLNSYPNQLEADKINAFNDLLDALERRFPKFKALRPFADAGKYVIDVVGAIPELFNLQINEYLLDWATDVEHAREAGTIDHAFKIDGDGVLTHNRMYFPPNATHLAFDYDVTTGSPRDALQIRFFGHAGEEFVFRFGQEAVLTQFSSEADEGASVRRAFRVDNRTGGFETFFVELPELLPGKVGSFQIVPSNGGAALSVGGFDAEVLVDNFRLVDANAQAATAALGEAGDGGTGGGSGAASLSEMISFTDPVAQSGAGTGSPAVQQAPPPRDSVGGDALFQNNLLLDLNDGVTNFTSPLSSELFSGHVETTLIYGVGEMTTTGLSERALPGSGLDVFGLTDLEARDAASGEVWLEALRSVGGGDGYVPADSAAAPFAGDSQVRLVPVSRGEQQAGGDGIVSQFSTSHLALPGNPDVQMQILGALGLPQVLAPGSGSGMAGVISDNAVTVLHDGASVDVVGPDDQTIYTGGASGFAVIDAADGAYRFDLTGSGDPYLVQARSVTGRRQGGVAQADTLGVGASDSVGFDFLSLFEGTGIEDFLELSNPEFVLSLDVTISPAGVVLGSGSQITVRADYAALFPDTSTETDPSDPVGTLDGLVTVVGFEGTIDLVTGALSLSADNASIEVDGVITATAAPVEDPMGGPDQLPAIEFTFDPTDDDPQAVLGTLRGLTATFDFLPESVAQDLVRIDEFQLRRDGFSIDATVGDPTGIIELGDDDPLVRLTGLTGSADLDVTFAPGFSAAGTVTIAANSTDFLPGSEINASLTGAELTIDVATGDAIVTADEFTMEVGDLLDVRATGDNEAPLTLDITSALTDPSAAILSVSLATISTGLFTDADGDDIAFQLSDLVIYGDGVSLGSAELEETDLLLATPGPDPVYVAELDDLAIMLTNLSFNVDTGFTAQDLTLSVVQAALLPDLDTAEFDGVATASGLSLDFDLQSGDFTITASSLDAALGDYFTLEVRESGGDDPVALRITDDPSTPLLSLPVVEANFVGLASIGGIDPADAPKVQVLGLEFFADGRWGVDEIGLADAAGFVFGLADFIPVAINSITINDFGTTADGNVDFNSFDFTVGLLVNWASPFFQSLPFTPYVSVGGVEVSNTPQGDNELLLSVAVDSLADARLRLLSTGAITIGFRDWDVGGLVFEGELTFGGFDQFGQLQPIDLPGSNDPDLSGFIQFTTQAGDVTAFDENDPDNAPNFERFDETSSPEGATAQADIEADSGVDISIDNGRIGITGDIDQSGGILSANFLVDIDAGLRFKLLDFFELYGVHFDFGFMVSTPVPVYDPLNPVGLFDPTFEVTRATLAVDALRLSLGADDPDATLEFTALGHFVGDDYFPAVEINFVPDPADPNVLATFGTLGVHFPDIFIIRDEGTPDEETSRIGGRVSGLRLLQGFVPDIDPDQGLSITGEFGDFFSPENQIFSWLPFRVDELSIMVTDQFFERDPDTDAIVGIDDPLAFDLEFSGGFVPTDIFGIDGVQFPLEATVDNMPVSVRNLKKFIVDVQTRGDLTYFPIKLQEIEGISFGIDPFSFFEDSPITFRGAFALGLAEPDPDPELPAGDLRSIYLRVAGEFAYSDWGGGVDLVISDRGPLLAKFNVPLAIPLGQTTLVLSGVEGGIAFGINELRSVEDPLDLVRDPVFVDPFDVSTDGIKEALGVLLKREQEEGVPIYTWGESFTIGLSGSITSVAVAGALSGEVTLVANVVWPEAGEDYIPDLRLFGTGNISLFGMPMGRAGLLLDYSNPLAPQLAFGIAAPAPGSPLQFLLPAQAEFGVLLTTDGIYEAPLLALRDFLVNGVTDAVLEPIADRLDDERSELLGEILAEFDPDELADAIATGFESTRALTRILLDVDANGVIDPTEAGEEITFGFIRDRLLVGGPGAPSILPTSFAALDGLSPDALMLASRATTSFLTEYFANPSIDIGTFTQAFAQSAVNAAANSWDAFKTRFDPKLLITGRIQPTLLGFPLGTPLVDGTIIVDKTGVAIALEGSILKVLQTALDMTTSGIVGSALKHLTLGLEDRTQFNYRFEFPSDELEDLVGGLLSGGLLAPGSETPGSGALDGDIAQLALDLINPFRNWEAGLTSEFTMAGLRFANVSGVMFDIVPPGDRGQFGTVVAGGSMLFPLDVANNDDPSILVPDGLPDPDRVAALDDYDLLAAPDVVNNATGGLGGDGTPDPLLLPIPPAAPGNRYEDILATGGILLTGQVFVPDVLRDPVAVLSNIQWEPSRNPEDDEPYELADFNNPVTAVGAFGQYSEWIGGVAEALTQVSEYGRMQTYIPSLSGLFDINNDLFNYGPDDRTDGVFDTLVDASHADLVVVQPGASAYLDNNQNGQFDPVMDTSLLWAPAEPVWDGDGDGVLNPVDGFIDLNGNNRYDEGLDQLVDADGSTDRSSTDLFFDLDRDGAHFTGGWYLDAGNGIFDDGEAFVDVGNGRYDAAEPFSDADSSGGWTEGDPFTDLNGNGVWDAGEAFVDLDSDMLYDDGEPFTDAGNGVYDAAEPFDDANGDRVWQPGEEFTDTNGNGLFDAGELFADLGNGVYDGPTSVASRVEFRDPTNPTVADELASILGNFYVEGYLDLQMLGIDFGKGYLRLDEQGFSAEASVPWALNTEIASGFRYEEISLTEAIDTFLDSPLVAAAVAPLGLQQEDLEAIQSLLQPGSGFPLPDYRIAAPVGFFEAGLSLDGLRDWLQDELGLPEEIVAADMAPQASAALGIYTPGYGDPDLGATPAQVYGGVQLEAGLSIPEFIEDALFQFEMSFDPIATSLRDDLPLPGGLGIPNFTAVAEAELFKFASLGALPDLLRLEGTSPGEPARITLEKQGVDLSGTVSGQVTVLDSLSLAANGGLLFDLDPLDPAVWGSVELVNNSRGSIALPGATLSADAFRLEFNSDDEDRPTPFGDVAPGLRVMAEGAVLALPGVQIMGDFGLAFDPATDTLMVSATDFEAVAGVGGVDVLALEGSGVVRLGAAGVQIDLDDLSFDATPPAGFTPFGDFDLVADASPGASFTASLLYDTLTGADTFVTLDIQDTLLRSNGLELAGNFLMSLTDSQFEIGASDVSLGVKFDASSPAPDFNLVSGSGGAVVLPTGVALAVDLELGGPLTGPAHFDFLPPVGGGAAEFVALVNTTGALQTDVGGSGLDVDAGVLAQVDMTTALNFGGFAVDGQFALTLGQGEYTITAMGAAGVDLGFLGAYEVEADAALVVDQTQGVQATVELTLPALPTPLPVTVNASQFLLNLDTAGASYVGLVSPSLSFWQPDESGAVVEAFRFDLPSPSLQFVPDAGGFNFDLANHSTTLTDLWAPVGLGRLASIESLHVGSDGSIDIQASFGIAEEEPLGVSFEGLEIVSFYGEITLDWSRRATVNYYARLHPDASVAASTGVSIFGQELSADFSVNVGHWGCLTIDAFGQTYYVNLRENPLGQNPFDPATIDSCTFDNEVQRTVAVGFDLAGYDPATQLTFDTLGATSIVGVTTSESLEDGLSLKAYGLTGGETVDVLLQFINPPPSEQDTVTELLERATNTDDYTRFPSSVVRLSAGSSVVIAQVSDDLEFELNELFGLAVSVVGSSGGFDTDVVFDEAHYTIQNDDRETLGQIIHYNFDAPGGADPYAFRKTTDSPNPDGSVYVSSGLFTHTDEITPNRAVQFDGVNDYIEAPLGPDSLSSQGFTVEAWVSPGDITGTEYLFGLGDSGGVYLNGDDGNLYVELPDADMGGLWIGNFGPYKNKWQHVAVSVFSSSVVQVHIDGSLAGQTLGPIVDFATQNFYIGVRQPGDPLAFTGGVDNVRVWQFGRTFQQIQDSYQTQLVGDEANLVGYWKFDREGLDFSENSSTSTASSGQPAVFGPDEFLISNVTSERPRSIVGPDGVDYSDGIVPLGRDRGLPKVSPSDPTQTDPDKIHAVASDRWRYEPGEAPLGPSLIINGGNETTRVDEPPMDGWVPVDPGWTTANYDPLTSPEVIEGGNYFHFEAPTPTSDGSLYQDIFVTEFADAIANGEQRFYFSTLYQTKTEGGSQAAALAYARVRFELYDRGGMRIGDFSTGELRSEGVWSPLSLTLGDPNEGANLFLDPLTDRVRVILEVHNSTRSDAYFDNADFYAVNPAKFYQFNVDISSLPEGQRLSLDGMRFFDHADLGGVTAYAVYTSLDNFTDPIHSPAAISSTAKEYGLQEITFNDPALSCLPHEEGSITFRIYGLGDNELWRVDNVGLMGTVHEADDDCPVAVDDVYQLTGGQSITFDALANDLGTGLTVDAVLPEMDVGDQIPIDDLGVLRRQSGGFRFDAAVDGAGTRSFLYKIVDADGLSDWGRVTLEVTPASMPLLYLPLDTDTQDVSGNDHHGILANTTFGQVSVPGVVGGAVEFDGVNDYIFVPGSPDLPGAGDDFTVAFWLKVDDWLNNEGIVASYTDNGITWNIGVSDPANALLIRADFGANVRYNLDVSSLANGEFVHFAAVITAAGGVEQAYVNGVPTPELGTTTFFNTNDSTGLFIGRRALTGANSRYLDGAVDEFQVFDRALTTAEVGAAYNSSRLVHFTLDETSGTTANDSGVNNNDGTLEGTTFAASNVVGRFGRALDFDGSTRIVVDNNANLPDTTDTYTVSYWVKFDDWDAPGGIVGSQHLNSVRWSIGYRESDSSLLIYSELGANIRSGIDVSFLPNNQFAHTAVVFSPTDGIKSVYINGEPYAEEIDDSFLPTNGGGFTLGSRTRNGVTSIYLDGVLDDFAIFDHELTFGELQHVMAYGAASLMVGTGSAGSAAPEGFADAGATPDPILPLNSPLAPLANSAKPLDIAAQRRQTQVLQTQPTALDRQQSLDLYLQRREARFRHDEQDEPDTFQTPSEEESPEERLDSIDSAFAEPDVAF